MNQGGFKLELYTERLRIIPLSLEHFRLLLDGMEKMETALNLNLSGERLDENTRKAMEGLYKQALENRDSYLWYTNWQIILRDGNYAIGSACFKTAPGITGEVEIGYGLYEKFRGKGYMSEAAKAITSWALEQDGVSSIIAETEKDNFPSHRVLQSCGFRRYKETEDGLFWHVTM
jgi:RimJ/RimL family protein N-acetyltransferase